MKKELEKIAKITGKEFAIVENGIAKKLNGSVIPIEHISYKEVHRDGYYYILPSICDGLRSGCRVGGPLLGCERYEEGRCGVYFFESIESFRIILSIEQCVLLIS